MSTDKNYNDLLKAELVELLEKRDTEITTLNNTNTALQTTAQQYRNTIGDLRKELEACKDTTREIETAEQLIEAILCLPVTQVERIPALVRTTDKGIEAYTAFVYGALSCVGASDTSGGSDSTDTQLPCEDNNGDNDNPQYT